MFLCDSIFLKMVTGIFLWRVEVTTGFPFSWHRHPRINLSLIWINLALCVKLCWEILSLFLPYVWILVFIIWSSYTHLLKIEMCTLMYKGILKSFTCVIRMLYKMIPHIWLRELLKQLHARTLKWGWEWKENWIKWSLWGGVIFSFSMKEAKIYMNFVVIVYTGSKLKLFVSSKRRCDLILTLKYNTKAVIYRHYSEWKFNVQIWNTDLNCNYFVMCYSCVILETAGFHIGAVIFSYFELGLWEVTMIRRNYYLITFLQSNAIIVC